MFVKALEEMMDKDFEAFFKSLIKIEKNVEDEDVCDAVYRSFMADDSCTSFLCDKIDEFIWIYLNEKLTEE